MKHVRVGVGVLIVSVSHPGCVLIGKRQGSHGANTFSLPGGHLEMNETVATCAVREIKEETDLDLDASTVRVVGVTQDVFTSSAKNKHYITLITVANVKPSSAALQNMEPHKCEGWEWVTLEHLKGMEQECFLPLQHALQTFLGSINQVSELEVKALKLNEHLSPIPSPPPSTDGGEEK